MLFKAFYSEFFEMFSFYFLFELERAGVKLIILTFLSDKLFVRASFDYNAVI